VLDLCWIIALRLRSWMYWVAHFTKICNISFARQLTFPCERPTAQWAEARAWVLWIARALHSTLGRSRSFRVSIEQVKSPMAQTVADGLELPRYLGRPGRGRTLVSVRAKETFFAQGDLADCVFFLCSGRVQLTAVSQCGKEATLALLKEGDFFGEDTLADVPERRVGMARALTPCTAIRVDRGEMKRMLHQDHDFSDAFLHFLLARTLCVQANLVDHLFNGSEKRLARTLLLMAGDADPELPIARITQEELAELIGTTRSRVSFFMNRFRRQGFIAYDGRIRVNKSLGTVLSGN
jgi:CRP/FNR family cyclic AMP-dependent transcriptional regulator